MTPKLLRQLTVALAGTKTSDLKRWRGLAHRHHLGAVCRRLTGSDVVLAQYGPTAAAVFPAAERLGIPLVCHFHGYDAYVESATGPGGEHYRDLATSADAVAVSLEMRERLLAIGFPSSKIHLVPYGIDIGRFHGARPAEAPPHFVAVGRFVEKKAPQLTITAFADAARDIPDAHLHYVGDGPLFDGSRDLARGLGIGEQITFHGVLPPDKIVDLFVGARAFIQHSVRAHNADSEGTPVAILEAMASGLPVIATRHAGIPDAVADGASGILVDPFDVRGMADAIRVLARSPDRAAVLGAAAQARVQADYNAPGQIAKLARVIEAAASGNR